MSYFYRLKVRPSVLRLIPDPAMFSNQTTKRIKMRASISGCQLDDSILRPIKTTVRLLFVSNKLSGFITSHPKICLLFPKMFLSGTAELSKSNYDWTEAGIELGPSKHCINLPKSVFQPILHVSPRQPPSECPDRLLSLQHNVSPPSPAVLPKKTSR